MIRKTFKNCVSPLVSNNRRQKLIIKRSYLNNRVRLYSFCICIYICLCFCIRICTVVIDIIMVVVCNNLILVSRPDLVIINKRKRSFQIVDFAVSVDERENERNGKRGYIFVLARKLKETMEHECDCDINCIGAHRIVTKALVKGWGKDLEIRGLVKTSQTTVL